MNKIFLINGVRLTEEELSKKNDWNDLPVPLYWEDEDGNRIDFKSIGYNMAESDCKVHLVMRDGNSILSCPSINGSDLKPIFEHSWFGWNEEAAWEERHLVCANDDTEFAFESAKPFLRALLVPIDPIIKQVAGDDSEEIVLLNGPMDFAVKDKVSGEIILYEWGEDIHSARHLGYRYAKGCFYIDPIYSDCLRYNSLDQVYDASGELTIEPKIL